MDFCTLIEAAFLDCVEFFLARKLNVYGQMLKFVYGDACFQKGLLHAV